MVLTALLVGCGWFDMPGRASAGVEPGKTPTIHTRTVVSEPYHIDRMYASMRGPYGFDDVALHTSDPPELLWIVGYRTTVIDGGSDDELSQEFMCHANLDFEASDYYDRFPGAPPISGRVFTLSQGQQDISFPEGFGIPVTSDLPITLATQVLNLTQPEADMRVRHRVDVRFVRDVEVEGEMVPLFQGAVEGFKALGDARFYGFSGEEVDHDELGPGCSLGQAAIAGDSDEDRLGQQFTAHWVVPPGREVNRTNVTRFLNLQFDTTIHYIAVHLHPFAESLTLRDITDDRTVFEAKVTPRADKVGIERIEHYSSAEGLKIHADHQYELISVYDNTSDKDVDSMAVMYLYMRNPNFRRPDLSSLKPASSDVSDAPKSPSM
ncbi:MAG: hypothetical protein KTR31_07065 [Myxococcales bacterium]|nr:hypothetical protein [Myxococcales bacterium]